MSATVERSRPAWRRRTSRLAVALLVGIAGPAAAQDSVVVIRPNAPDIDTVVAGPPLAAVRQAIERYNDSATMRIPGSFTLPAGARLDGRIAVFRGNLRVHGRGRHL
jgi:hypothetical protein